jgi:hypothetical protein
MGQGHALELFLDDVFHVVDQLLHSNDSSGSGYPSSADRLLQRKTIVDGKVLFYGDFSEHLIVLCSNVRLCGGRCRRRRPARGIVMERRGVGVG